MYRTYIHTYSTVPYGRRLIDCIRGDSLRISSHILSALQTPASQPSFLFYFTFIKATRTMTDPALGIAEAIQTASINRDPSPSHDINPATAASERKPVAEHAPSEAGSIPSDIVDPHRMIRPAPRRHTLPPMPDLRFEQSYLASLRGADTWGRVAWITIRDQVCGFPRPLSERERKAVRRRPGLMHLCSCSL
jgi:hypothetical protein